MALFPALTSTLLYCALCFTGAIPILAWRHLRPAHPSALRLGVMLALIAGATLGAWLETRSPITFFLPAVMVLAVLVARLRLRDFTHEGLLFLASYIAMVVSFVTWGFGFLLTIPVSPMTRGFLLAGFPLLMITLPSGLLQSVTDLEVLCRSSVGRFVVRGGPTRRARYPKVSLHVPAYSEPPELVIATLDALAALDYPNYEVLVIDNNTRDQALWRPVERHCERLGPTFRFYHLEQWPGAKAGALNFALGVTAKDAEVIGVVDADYLADPDFLSHLIGHFDDPRMGFVQTPHDYRDWEDSLYLRMCYWEYRYFFASTMVTLDRHDAALTVGTMCLIRRRALEEAGGWSEWCVTEDSELAIRIHACGYDSVYLPTTFGRGLIPQTFGGFKRQRFRWTYGPIQELKRHLRLFLPRTWRMASPSALTPVQKLLHLNHGLDRMNVGLQFLVLPFAAAAMVSMIAHRELIAVPTVLWATSTVTLIGGWVMWWLPYRVLLGASIGDAVGAFVASKALGHTITMSAVKSLYTERIPWQRTNKFPELPMGLGALWAARTELMLGLVIALAGFAALVLMPHRGLLLLLVIGGFYQSLGYFAAPAMSVLGEWDLIAESRRARTEAEALSLASVSPSANDDARTSTAVGPRASAGVGN